MSTLRNRIAFLLTAALLSNVVSLAQEKSSAGDYRVLTKFNLGGEGGWDYIIVEPGGHRLFVTRGSHVMVVDAETGKPIGDIPDTSGVHGVAISEELGVGYTSNGRSNNGTRFDLKTLKPLGTIETGQNPDAILFEPATKRFFTFNGRGHSATAIEGADGKGAGTVELGGKPEAAVSDGRGTVYVNIEDKSEVVRFDARELKVTARWPIAPGEEPSGLALDAKSRRLFAVCGNEKLVVLDAESGKVITTLAIGKRTDGAAFDPETRNVFSSNGDGTLTIVHENDADHFEIVQTLKTQPGARTIALDPATHRLYLPTALFEDPPAQAPEGGRARPRMKPDSFTVVVVGR